MSESKKNPLSQIEEDSLDDFLTDVCIMLDIDVPKIIVDDEYLSSLNSICRSEFDLKTGETRIIVKSKYENKLLLFASLAHELRHHWQFRKYGIEWLEAKTRGELSPDEYNLQRPELDAQAFVAFVIKDFYSIRIIFNELKKETSEIIYRKAAELEKTDLDSSMLLYLKLQQF